jgi:hypothetical protein
MGPTLEKLFVQPTGNWSPLPGPQKMAKIKLFEVFGLLKYFYNKKFVFFS